MRLLFCPQSYEFFLTLHLVISTDSTEVHCRCLEMIFGSEGTKTNFELFLEQMFFLGVMVCRKLITVIKNSVLGVPLFSSYLYDQGKFQGFLSCVCPLTEIDDYISVKICICFDIQKSQMTFTTTIDLRSI